MGGAELVLHHLVSQCVRHGDSVRVLAPRARERAGAPAMAYEVHRFFRPFTKRFGTRLVLPRLARLRRAPGLDVLHCHSCYPQAYVARTFKRLFKVPVVVRPHGSDILPGRRICRDPRLARRVRMGLQEADAVIAQSAFIRQVAIDYGVDERHIHLIRNGVDLAAFAAAARRPHPRPYLLGLGRLVRYKGFDVLLEAYARLRPEPDLLIAGDGREAEALRRLAGELGIAGRVRFLGLVSGQEKIDLYRGAACFVCPSREEPFGNVILEAFAAGTPVVAAAVGGILDSVGDNERGRLFDAGRPDALAAALREALDHPARTEARRRAATEFVRQQDWPLVAQRYRALYRSLASRAPRRT